jgi:tetratricopeptide (TPR) repeat protein
MSHNPDVLRISLSGYLCMGKYDKAEALLNKIKNMNQINSGDLCTWGLIYSLKDMNSTAMEYYSQSLEMNPKNLHTLYNIGYTYNLRGEYEKAIEISNQVLQLDENFPYAYNCLGLAKIKMGNESGYEDIKKGLTLDEENSYGYLNLGIYYLDKGNKELALQNFKKAKELDRFTHKIDEYIEKTRK